MDIPILDLRALDLHSLVGEIPVLLTWKLIFLTAIRDGASEICYNPAANTILYVADGKRDELEPPPLDLAPTLIDLLDGLFRPGKSASGWRRFANAVVCGLERMEPGGVDVMLLRIGDRMVRMERTSTEEWPVHLHLHLDHDLAVIADAILTEYLAIRGKLQDTQGHVLRPPAL